MTSVLFSLFLPHEEKVNRESDLGLISATRARFTRRQKWCAAGGLSSFLWGIVLMIRVRLVPEFRKPPQKLSRPHMEDSGALAYSDSHLLPIGECGALSVCIRTANC